MSAQKAPTFLQWWTSHDVDERTSMIRNAIGNRENTLNLVRIGFNAGRNAAQLAALPPNTYALRHYLRQYRHNDDSEGFVFAYEKEGVDRLVASLRAQIAKATACPKNYGHPHDFSLTKGGECCFCGNPSPG